MQSDNQIHKLQNALLAAIKWSNTAMKCEPQKIGICGGYRSIMMMSTHVSPPLSLMTEYNSCQHFVTYVCQSKVLYKYILLTYYNQIFSNTLAYINFISVFDLKMKACFVILFHSIFKTKCWQK